MKAYKNLDIYQMAFNLAIKVYRLNMTLSAKDLQNQGNKLRWSSLKIKDMIAEAHIGIKNKTSLLKDLTTALIHCDDVIALLKKIGHNNPGNKQITGLIKNYKSLKRKMEGHIRKIREENSESLLQFPENKFNELV
jgi:four helix bundle protein